MKPKYVIFARDNNPLYEGFWEVVSEVCRKILKLTPVLFHVDKNEGDFHEDKYGIIKKIKAVDNIDTGFQSQIVRMYGCKFFPENVCITSDIDMIMMCRNYFVDQISEFDDDAFVVFTSNVHKGKRYPICYNAAKGKHYSLILGCDCSFEDYAQKLRRFNNGWNCDEIYFTRMLDSSNFPNIIKLHRHWDRRVGIADKRIDRKNWEWSREENYIDCHCPRPYLEHKEKINKLVNHILKEEK